MSFFEIEWSKITQSEKKNTLKYDVRASLWVSVQGLRYRNRFGSFSDHIISLYVLMSLLMWLKKEDPAQYLDLKSKINFINTDEDMMTKVDNLLTLPEDTSFTNFDWGLFDYSLSILAQVTFICTWGSEAQSMLQNSFPVRSRQLYIFTSEVSRSPNST